MESSYLYRKGETWYVRLMVPKASRKVLGKTKYVRSLKTRDKAEANRLKHAALAELNRELAEALAALTADPHSARTLLRLAEEERRRVESGEVNPERAEVDFRAAVDLFLEREAKRRGTDKDTGHPLISEADEGVIRAAHAVMAGEGVTLLERAAELYLNEVSATVRKQTVREKERALEKLVRWLGPAQDVRKVTRRVAGRYVTTKLVPEGKAPKTTRDEIGHLSAFFAWLDRRGEVEGNPFYRVSGSVRESTRGTKPKRRPWKDDELLTALQGIPTGDPLWPLVAIGAYSGMRREEIALLRAEDIEGNTWTVKAAKNQSSIRTVPIHPAIRPLVKSLSEASTDGFLIPGLLSGGADAKRGHLVGKRFTDMRRGLGITDPALNLHTLRNAFLQRCEEAGVPLPTAKQLCGHKRQDQTYGGYSPGGSLGMLEKAISKITYGKVDAHVRKVGREVTVTKLSRPRGARNLEFRALNDKRLRG